jgi:hypothetical protein
LANAGLLVYNLQRVFPDILPRRSSERVQKRTIAIAAGAICVSSAEVCYVPAREREG